MANVCLICNNPLRQYSDNFYVCDVCETYFDKNENIVLTEQEWLQTATTEQLAKALTKVVLDLISWNNDPKPSEVRNVLKAWLKRPHPNELLTSK